MLDQLIAQFAKIQGPRYTSYPTAVEFSSQVDATIWRDALAHEVTQLNGTPPKIALYLHIPFCKTMCFFCACNKVVTKDRSGVAPYLHALRQEIEWYAAHLPQDSILEQLHWGGGTPNYLLVDEMIDLSRSCKRAFPNWGKDADISIELDPRTATFEQLTALRELGFNRLSLGVQDFDSEVQRIVNRIQPYESVKTLITSARSLGFTSIGVDLIYGLPGQTAESFAQTLSLVKQLRPERIALYAYAHVTWKSKAQSAFDVAVLPSPSERIALFTHGTSTFLNDGYSIVGMDHFSLPDDSLARAAANGSLNRNFMGFTTHKNAWVIGCGPSAVSTIPSAYSQNTKDIQDYQRQIALEGIATERGVLRSQDDRLRGEIIETILCGNALNIKDLEAQWKIDFWSYFGNIRSELADLERRGLLTLFDESIQITECGRLFARIIAMLFDAYLSKYRQDGSRVFSQAV